MGHKIGSCAPNTRRCEQARGEDFCSGGSVHVSRTKGKELVVCIRLTVLSRDGIVRVSTMPSVLTQTGHQSVPLGPQYCGRQSRELSTVFKSCATSFFGRQVFSRESALPTGESHGPATSLSLRVLVLSKCSSSMRGFGRQRRESVLQVLSGTAHGAVCVGNLGGELTVPLPCTLVFTVQPVWSKNERI